MSDHETVDRLLGGQAAHLPTNLESIPNPKEFLLDLAKRGAPRDVKRDLLPERGAKASQGLGYNRRLCDHVNRFWSPRRAARRSDSLSRLISRLIEFADRKCEKGTFRRTRV